MYVGLRVPCMNCFVCGPILEKKMGGVLVALWVF